MFQLLVTLAPIFAIPGGAAAQEAVREVTEWADISVSGADRDDLPRVLLMGDSIAYGYFGGVAQRLAGKAYCARLTTSKCVADPAFLDEVRLMLKQYRFAVIHFNNGLHGYGYTEEQYRDGLVSLMETFKENAGSARLIWATTTPVREPDDPRMFTQGTERVRERNRIAAEIVAEWGALTNDLYGLVEQRPELFSVDGVHYNNAGQATQTEQVAESVMGCMAGGD